MSAQPLMNSFAPTHAGVKYLADRGITPEIAEAMGIKFTTHGEVDEYLKREADQRSFYPKRDAIWIPTHEPSGLLHPHHGQAIFFAPGKKPFKRHTETNDEFPNEVNYLLAKPLTEGSTLYWCESTIKAAILRYHFGLNAVGMNGVSGFTQGKGRIVNSAKSLPSNLVHILVQDSLNDKNKKSFANVLGARRRWRLTLRGQLTAPTLRYIELPKPPSAHPKADWGLDDIFVSHGGTDTVRGLLQNTSEFHDTAELSVWLDEFNSKFVYVKSLSKVYDRELNRFLSKNDFFSNCAPNQCGGKPVAPVWFSSIERQEVRTLAFRPGKPEIVDGCLNIWRGFDVEPHSNDILVHKYWLETIYDAFGPDGKHFIEFAAALVQLPGKRLSRHVYLGGKQGTGKNFIIEPLVRIFGSTHCQAWSVANFINNFNSTHQACRLGIVNEPGDPKAHDKKTLVAVGELLKKNADQNERYLQLEAKGADIAVVDRLQSNITISNYGPPFDLQAGDRRCIALRARQGMGVVTPITLGEKSLEYWSERWHWLNYENGAAEVMAYLLAYDLRNVDLDGPAPVTAYKQELTQASIDRVKPFMEQFNANPEAMFQSVLGDDFRLEYPFVFDSSVIAALYTQLVHAPDVPSAFSTSVGSHASSTWECRSTRVSMRVKGHAANSATETARVFAIVDNRIREYNAAKSGLKGDECIGKIKALCEAILKAA